MSEPLLRVDNVTRTFTVGDVEVRARAAAAQAIGRNKMRSALTMLDVFIGVAALIVMVAVGQGADEAVRKQIESLGPNVVVILPGAVTFGGISAGFGSAVAILRRTRPNVRRSFRTPFVPFVPLAGLGFSLWLLSRLPVIAWTRFVIWMTDGLAVYALYGRRHSLLANNDHPENAKAVSNHPESR